MKKAVLAIGLFSSSLSAQYIGSWNFHSGWVQSESTNSMNRLLSRSVQERSDERDGAAAIHLTEKAQSAQLDFTPSMQRRQANYASFVERSRKVDPAGAAGLAANLKLDPIALMKPQLAQVGLRTDNLADAYAAYWIEAWEAVHGVTGQTSREKADAVSRQSANAILATPAIAAATPAQKQELAEAMLVQAMLVAAAREQANGDEAKLAEIGRAVEKGASASGLDLRAMTLTEDGFLPAKRTGAADPAPGAEPRALAVSGEAGSRPGYGFLAAAGGAGLGAAFLMGKAMGRRG